jgi:thiol-disulfide isomerase/thioredoxin
MNILMMYLKKYKARVLCLLQFAAMSCMAQLQVNDTCPDISFTSAINTINSASKLSLYKGKAVIIDFWDTRCHSCLESFPTIDSLQKKFKKELQIILITKQDHKTIDNFFSKFKKIKMPGVPLVTDDTLFTSLFPSEGYPYIVWLDQNRTVKYFTSGYNMTSDHFEKFLKGIELDVKPAAKKTVYSPLWHLEDSVFLNNVKYFSSLTSCINGIDTHVPDEQLLNSGKAQINSNCSSLFTLIKKAFGENGKYPVNTKYGLEINIDSSLLFRPSDPNLWDGWDKDHLFNYQLILPASQKEILYKRMQEDIQRYLGISIVPVKKKIKGYALTNLNGECIPISKNKQTFDAYNNGDIENTETLRFINQPFDRLTSLLNFWIHNSFPFRNVVQDHEKIDFTIRKSSINPLNIKALNEDLKKLNLELKEEDFEIDVLTINWKK